MLVSPDLTPSPRSAYQPPTPPPLAHGERGGGEVPLAGQEWRGEVR